MRTNTSANSSPLSFDNTEIAFKHKTNAELSRAYWLFKAININFLTKIGPPLVNLALKLRLPIIGVIKKTIFVVIEKQTLHLIIKRIDNFEDILAWKVSSSMTLSQIHHIVK